MVTKIISVLCMTTLLLAAGAAGADTRVSDAAMQGNRDLVRSSLKLGADVNTAHGDGMTALHWAAYKDDLELATMLLVAGANVSAQTRINSMTPLFLAAQNGNVPLIDALLKAGASVNGTLTSGATPLMHAARSGNADAVKLLLDHGASVHATEGGRGETALMFAAANNRPAVIKVLMARGAKSSMATTVVNVAAKTAVERGARGGRGTPPAAVAGALAVPAAPVRGGGGNMDEDQPSKIETMGGLTALLLASRQGHIESARALVEAGANINELSPGDRTSPLLISTINGHFDLARVLLESGADPNLASTAGATPLYTTLNVKWAPKTDYPQPDTKQEKTSYLDLLKALLDRGADPNARLKMELWYSGYNFELTSTDPGGATAFWRAAQASDVAAMRLLLNRGADPRLKAAAAVSPLHVATGAGVHGNDEVTATGSWMPGVQYLVNELHADVNEPDDRGLTALHHAASRGDNDMIIFLVSKGARADAVAKNGQTIADIANGPRQRIQPFHDTVALLMLLGSRNSHKCVSC